MADEPDNLVLELLRGIEAKLDVVAADLAETIASADRCLAHLEATEHGPNGLNRSRYRIEASLDRIEGRVGVIGAKVGAFGARPGSWRRRL